MRGGEGQDVTESMSSAQSPRCPFWERHRGQCSRESGRRGGPKVWLQHLEKQGQVLIFIGLGAVAKVPAMQISELLIKKRKGRLSNACIWSMRQ